MFQNSYGPDGSININVVPSFGHIVTLPEQQKVVTVHISFISSSHKFKDGEQLKEHLEQDQLTLIQADMLHSVPEKLCKTQ
jgi:hypothetical protein